MSKAIDKLKSQVPPHTLGDGSKGQYFIPGIGEYGKKKNLAVMRKRRIKQTSGSGIYDKEHSGIV